MKTKADETEISRVGVAGKNGGLRVDYYGKLATHNNFVELHDDGDITLHCESEEISGALLKLARWHLARGTVRRIGMGMSKVFTAPSLIASGYLES